MPAVMGKNLKKISVFIDKYGNQHQQSPEEFFAENGSFDNGGFKRADRVSEEASQAETEVKE